MIGRATRRVIGVAAVAAAGLGVLALPSLAAKDDLDLISRATGGGPATNLSVAPRVSADGRFVVFTSFAANLSTEDVDAVGNVFIRDTLAGTTTL